MVAYYYDRVWQSWTTDSTAASTNTITVDPAWQSWTVTTSVTYNATDVTWRRWNALPAYQLRGDRWERTTVRANVPAPTPEGQAAAQAEIDAMNAERRARADESIAAVARAEAILRENLTPTQRRALDRWGGFKVIAGSGKTYRIDRGQSGNVKELGRSRVGAARVVASYCIHPTGLPTADVMLAQKLLLEANEPEFLRIANRTAA